MSEGSESPQVRFILREWGQAFEKKDLDIIAKCLHKDYRHAYYPQSLGRPEQTREEWLEHFTEVSNLWTDSNPTVHSVIDAPGKVIIHITNRVNTSIGIEMVRESIFTNHIVTDEDGSLKITRIEEFTDSKTYLDFVQAVAAAKAKE